MDYRNCVMCRRGLHNRRYQQHVLAANLPHDEPPLAMYIQEHAQLEVVFDNTRRVCHRCWQRATNEANRIRAGAQGNQQVEVPDDQQVQVPDDQQVQVPDDQQVQVPDEPLPQNNPRYSRAPNTSRHCIYNNCRNTSRLRIPEAVKTYILLTHRLFVPENSRVCREHLNNNEWEDLPGNCNVSYDFNTEQCNSICEALRTAALKDARLDFESIQGISNAEMFFWTGRNIDEFNTILQECTSLNRLRQPRTALGVYLSKLRTGEPDERMATLFNISRRKQERLLHSVRSCLVDDYVSHHLGFDHLTRENVLDRNLLIPKGIFGNDNNTKAILILDGTYIYIQKSTNYLFQRQSYSLHKYVNLLKPFIIVCTDGYIVDVLGPYSATKSDASIMRDILANEEHPLLWFLEQDDVLILDRGFRDSLPDIESCGFEGHMPPTKDRYETQLTTTQANFSRLVTICRWVVEVVNGRFKRDFKLLRQDYNNRALPHMMADFKIAAAITNHFHEPIVNNDDAETILEFINTSINRPNILFEYVDQNNLNRRRTAFEPIDANLPQLQNFPALSEHDLKRLSLGTYHLKLARSYCAEHLQNGIYTLEVYRENQIDDFPNIPENHTMWLLKGRVQSRHVRARTYYTYVLIDPSQQGRDTIIEHYCTCLTGRRTIGTCAHVVSIVWYLGYGRYNQFDAPAMFLNEVIVD